MKRLVFLILVTAACRGSEPSLAILDGGADGRDDVIHPDADTVAVGGQSGATGKGGEGGSGGQSGVAGMGGRPSIGGQSGSGGTGGAGGQACLDVAASWVGTYEISRIVISYPEGYGDPALSGRTVTFTPGGVRDESGVTWSVKGRVQLNANGNNLDVYMETYRNGSHYGSMQQAGGKWSREGTAVLVADYQGDQAYRRKWSATVNLCQLKLMHIYPPNFGFDTNGYWQEYREVDLTRTR